ncbi:MAG: iron-sulfur cluster assembly protein [Verrucomicrobiota bacterium]|nr:iron-sulfur cluster assembly protein [Verrucomicrobiota bacterium]
MKHTEVTLLRDCQATLIPEGIEITLPAGTSGLITQALGGSVTIRTERGLVRINPGNADAFPADIAAKLAATAKSVTSVDDGAFSEAAIWAALRQCFDPEIPVNIVDLGLIYDLRATAQPEGKHHITVRMTLTAPGCGMGPSIAADAKAKIEQLASVSSADVQIVWDPQWTPQMISSDGRKMLGLD